MTTPNQPRETAPSDAELQALAAIIVKHLYPYEQHKDFITDIVEEKIREVRDRTARAVLEGRNNVSE